MSRRALALVIFIATFSAAACGTSPSSGSPNPDASGAPGSPVVGVITAVDSAGLTDVRGFTIRTDDGRSLAFELGALENATEFPPGHLGEHLASSEPVRVWFRDEAGGLVAYRIEDAGV